MSEVSSSTYSKSGISGGIGGLVSGLDTDSLVEQLSAGTQIKINRQFQLQQTEIYRQDAYRGVIDKLVGFQDKYFSYSSKTNLMSPKFFDSAEITSSFDSVSATGNTDVLRNLQITDITSVASKTKFASTHSVSSGKLESDTIESSKTLSSLAGRSMSIKYGDTTYNITLSKNFDLSGATDAEKLQSVADEINAQIAKVDGLKGKMEYEVDGSKLKINNIDGGDVKITAVDSKISQTLNIGKDSNGNSDADIVVADLNYESLLSDVLSNGEIKFEYNGLVKSVKLVSKDFTDKGYDMATITSTQLADVMQDELNAAFGTGKVTVNGSSGKLEFTPTGSTNIFGVSAISSDLGKTIGVRAGDYNRINKSVELSELNDSNIATNLDGGSAGTYKLSVNGKEFTFDSSYTINDIMSEISNDQEAGVEIVHSSLTDKFTIYADNSGTQGKIEISDVEGNLSAALFGNANINDTVGAEYTQGTNANIEVKLNGQVLNVERSSNTFDVDGVSLTLNTNAAEKFSAAEPVTFNVNENPDELAENVSKFVDDYNELITFLDKAVSTKHDKKYPPLTDAQRKEMSAEEEKNWDEKAKEGMLFSNNNVSRLYYDLRSAIGSIVKDNNLTMGDLGISSSFGDYTGKLSFDKEKFKETYGKDPSAVKDFFTNTSKNGSMSEVGIAGKIKAVLSNNIGTIGENGILVREAGTKGTPSENSNFAKTRIDEYQKMIDTLKDRLKVERKRYWDQFTRLETVMQNLNTQSSWLADQAF